MIAVVNGDCSGLLYFSILPPGSFRAWEGFFFMFLWWAFSCAVCVGRHVHLLTLYGCFIIWYSLSFHTPNTWQTHLVIGRNSVKDMFESALVCPPACALALTSNYTCAAAAISPGHNIWLSCASLSLHKYNKCNKYQVFLPQKFSQVAGSVESAKELRLGTISRECGWVVPVLISELCIPKQWFAADCRNCDTAEAAENTPPGSVWCCEKCW